MELSDDIVKLLAERTDQACAEASAWHDVSPRLRQIDPEDERLGSIAQAFDYLLRHPKIDEGPDVFIPMITLASGESYPQPLHELAENVVDVWSRVSTEVRDSIAAARLNDLLFERKEQPVKDRATRAIAAYRNLAQGRWEDLERSECLLRALAIARAIKDSGLIDAVSQNVLEEAKASLEGTGPKPGVTLPLLEVLVEQAIEDPIIDDLLARSREVFAEAYLVEHIVDLQKTRARGDQKLMTELDRQRIEAWFREAESASGLVRVVHLQTAARLAQDLGQKDLLVRARQQLQGIDADELEMKVVSAEASVPPEALEAFLSQFTEPDHPRDALLRFIAYGPATGELEENRKALAQARTQFPMRYLISRVRVGSDGLPRWQPTSDEDREDMDLADHELLRMQISGQFLLRALWRIGEHYRVQDDDLVVFFEELPNLDGPLAHLLTKAYMFFWREDFTASAFLAVPLIEALARRLVLATGRPVYQTQRASRPGQYPGLGFLIGQLRVSGLEESWHRYLWTFLASPAGLNYRNELAHGFVTGADPVHSTLLLQIATYLASLKPASPQST